MPALSLGAKVPPGDFRHIPVSLSEVGRVKQRFLRSVHLERDFYAPGSTDGYVPTPAALTTLRRILAGVRTPGARAFSITGPYGSGKSAFALTLAKSLAASPWGDGDLRARAEAEFGETLFDAATDGLFPVLIVGGREPIASALVGGLRRALQTAGVRVPLPDVPPSPTGAEVARFFESVTERLTESAPAIRGLLVIVDEAGKFLEHAALHPDSGDMQALQEMAEAAVRSPIDAPLFFVTVFHQAFEEYAGRLSAKERNEWRKVQGRFADIAFADAPEETLRLVARAIDRLPDADRDAAIATAAQSAARTVASLNLLPRNVSETEFATLTDRAYPLHPLTLLALPYVFRRFGQGERSLFGFLAGDEPGGLGVFLADSSPLSPQPPFPPRKGRKGESDSGVAPLPGDASSEAATPSDSPFLPFRGGKGGWGIGGTPTPRPTPSRASTTTSSPQSARPH